MTDHRGQSVWFKPLSPCTRGVGTARAAAVVVAAAVWTFGLGWRLDARMSDHGTAADAMVLWIGLNVVPFALLGVILLVLALGWQHTLRWRWTLAVWLAGAAVLEVCYWVPPVGNIASLPVIGPALVPVLVATTLFGGLALAGLIETAPS